MKLWACDHCRVTWGELCWPDPFGGPAPACMTFGCGQPCSLYQACPHCEGTGFVEAARFGGGDAGPCGECRGGKVKGEPLTREDFD